MSAQVDVPTVPEPAVTLVIPLSYARALHEVLGCSAMSEWADFVEGRESPASNVRRLATAGVLWSYDMYDALDELVSAIRDCSDGCRKELLPVSGAKEQC